MSTEHRYFALHTLIQILQQRQKRLFILGTTCIRFAECRGQFQRLRTQTLAGKSESIGSYAFLRKKKGCGHTQKGFCLSKTELIQSWHPVGPVDLAHRKTRSLKSLRLTLQVDTCATQPESLPANTPVNWTVQQALSPGFPECFLIRQDHRREKNSCHVALASCRSCKESVWVPKKENGKITAEKKEN